jgi:hypothetical protein
MGWAVPTLLGFRTGWYRAGIEFYPKIVGEIPTRESSPTLFGWRLRDILW